MSKLFLIPALLFIYCFIFVFGLYCGIKLMVKWGFVPERQDPISQSRVDMYNRLMLKDCLIELKQIKGGDTK